MDGRKNDALNDRQRKLERYLESRIAACRQRGKLLAADGRGDEGNFERIRANVYEIFQTILSAAERACEQDASARKRFFLQKLRQIPASWTASYEAARQHGDVERMHIESIKLDAVREIKDMCLQIWEGPL